MSILHPKKEKYYTSDAAIEYERILKKEEEMARRKRKKVPSPEEVAAERKAALIRKKKTSGLIPRYFILKNALKRSQKRGGPINPGEIQEEMNKLTAQIQEIWPDWQDKK